MTLITTKILKSKPRSPNSELNFITLRTFTARDIILNFLKFGTLPTSLCGWVLTTEKIKARLVIHYDFWRPLTLTTTDVQNSNSPAEQWGREKEPSQLHCLTSVQHPLHMFISVNSDIWHLVKHNQTNNRGSIEIPERRLWLMGI